MIIIRPHGTFIKGFTVKGHAGAGKMGTDIVCASVSVVTQMIAFELHLKGIASYQIEDGELYVSINTFNCMVEDEERYVEGIMDMMVRTLDALSIQYPDHITLKEEY